MIKALIPEYPPSHYNYDRREGSPESLDGLTDDEDQRHPFISPRDLPGYGTWSGTTHDTTSKAMTQEEKDTDLLIEYFACWALINCDKYRKFYALTRFKPQQRWENWSHVSLLTDSICASFLRTLQTDWIFKAQYKDWDIFRETHQPRHQQVAFQSPAHINASFPSIITRQDDAASANSPDDACSFKRCTPASGFRLPCR
jgi:hypothetical protein